MTEGFFKETEVSFATTDYVIFILMLVVSLLIGMLTGLKNFKETTKDDFLLGGSSMNLVPVSLSLVGGVISALSAFGNPTETYLYGTQIWMNLIGILIGTITLMVVLLPVLYPLKLFSINQYLEMRYESTLIKKMASLGWLVNTWVYLGICLYAPSLALSAVTPLSTTASCICLGLICTIYSSIGGVKGIIYTDVFQTITMFVGIAAVIVEASLQVGGPLEIFKRAEEGERLEWFNFDPNPLVRHTFWTVNALGIFWSIHVLGLSQAQYQRLVSVKTFNESLIVCVAFYIGVALLWSMFYFAGLVAYATYVGCDPLERKAIESADQIIPYLVVDKLRHYTGLAGLFVAAVYGAVLSSYSSQTNSFAALVWEDFLSESSLVKGCAKSQTFAIRIISICAGLLGISAAFVISGLGTLMETAMTVNTALSSPMSGIFVAGILAPWVEKKGAICGFLTAVTWNLWIMFGKYVNKAGKAVKLPLTVNNCTEVIYNETFESELYYEVVDQTTTSLPALNEKRDYLAIYDLSYCYYGLLAIAIVVVVGTVVSLGIGPKSPSKIDPTLVQAKCLKAYEYFWNKCHSTSPDEREANRGGGFEMKSSIMRN